MKKVSRKVKKNPNSNANSIHNYTVTRNNEQEEKRPKAETRVLVKVRRTEGRTPRRERMKTGRKGKHDRSNNHLTIPENVAVAKDRPFVHKTITTVKTKCRPLRIRRTCTLYVKKCFHKNACKQVGLHKKGLGLRAR